MGVVTELERLGSRSEMTAGRWTIVATLPDGVSPADAVSAAAGLHGTGDVAATVDGLTDLIAQIS